MRLESRVAEFVRPSSATKFEDSQRKSRCVTAFFSKCGDTDLAKVIERRMFASTPRKIVLVKLQSIAAICKGNVNFRVAVSLYRDFGSNIPNDLE